MKAPHDDKTRAQKESTPMAASGDERELDDRAPVLGSWRNVYAFVAGALVVSVVVFTLITRSCA